MDDKIRILNMDSFWTNRIATILTGECTSKSIEKKNVSKYIIFIGHWVCKSDWKETL